MAPHCQEESAKASPWPTPVSTPPPPPRPSSPHSKHIPTSTGTKENPRASLFLVQLRKPLILGVIQLGDVLLVPSLLCCR